MIENRYYLTIITLNKETYYKIIDIEEELPDIKYYNKKEADKLIDFLNHQHYLKEHYQDESVKYHRRVNELLTENNNLKITLNNLIKYKEELEEIT